MGKGHPEQGQVGPPSHLWLFQIRRSMIDGNKGHKQIRTLVKSLDEVRRWWRRGRGRVDTVAPTHTRPPPHLT